MTVFANDEDLLRRFRAGDREALSAVYWHYVGSVENLLRRCLNATSQGWHVASSADLADVVQDVFVNAFAERARLSYDPRREYRPFLMAIARNALIDHLRGAPREVRLDVATIDSLVARDARGEAAAERVPWTDPQMMMLVDRYVASLAVKERAVYLERYVHCRSQEHAATALGMSRQQVRTLESRLREGLAQELARARLASSGPRYIGPDVKSDNQIRAAAVDKDGGSL
jgi:RNA polymerase sigma factor (sigma-70 family)